MKRGIWLTATIAALGATAAMAIEEPSYQVIETHDEYEIRRYDSFIVAETEVPVDHDSADSAAFRVLAGYIFGDNRAADSAGGNVKMAMTAPVLSTAPNAVNRDAHIYRFVMPAKYDLDSLPVPLDSRVTIREIPGQLVAVRRYSGRWNLKGFSANESILRDALQKNGVTPVGPTLFARYNAPYTPWFMRRNEVMLAVGSYEPS